MNIDIASRIVGTSAPFFVSIVAQALGKHARQFAIRSIPIVFPKNVTFLDQIAESAADLAMYVYTHTSFFIAILVAAATCAGDALLAKQAMGIVVAITVLLIIMLLWFFLWQGLSMRELESNSFFALAGYAAVIILWTVSIYTALSPVAPLPSAKP
jgi:hypothetical protein